MLLRASGEALDQQPDLRGTVGEGDACVRHGARLVRFAEAATRGDSDLDGARSALAEEIGFEAFVEAAATVAIFNGLVRTADATGIPLDDGTLRASVDFREELGLNDYAGARSTDLASAGAGESTRDPRKLFFRDGDG